MEINLRFNWGWQDLKNAFYCDSQYATIISGRGTGKTYNAFQWLTRDVLVEDIESGLWFDTVQSNIDIYVETYLEKHILAPIWKLCRYDRQKHRLYLPRDKYIQFASAEEPKNAEGFRYNRAVLNEGGLILKKASLWDNTVEPMTHPIDGNNKTRIIGTPKGKNKFHLLHTINDPDWKHFQFNAYESPYVNKEVLDKVKNRVPEQVWRQEYMAEFLEDAGTVFRNISQCVREPRNLKIDYIGVDLGKHQDFTVITPCDSEKKQCGQIERFNQIDWHFQKQRILNYAGKYPNAKIILDSTGIGDPIYDDLRSSNVNVEGFKITKTSKQQLIESLSIAIDNKEIFFPPDEILLNELESFGYDVSPSGNIRYGAPSGMHDDCVLSLALVNYQIRQSVPLSIGWV